ncbi:unnamed protein product, partial [Mesorhabditis belari]|uniref:Protein kinase domain-containing protein n=1 Tax=Mesorhabditis belari TaxID=2138241 RepID=A0AAF3EX70_9BILA
MQITISPSTECLIPSLRTYLDADLNDPPIFATNHSLVFRANSQRFRSIVAIKIINRKALPQHVAEKFLTRELDVTRKVRHPHLLKCLLINSSSPSKIVIVSEYCARGTLLQMILTEGNIKETPTGARLFRQLIEAVQYLHARGVIHRDIKLENIFLDANGDLKLGDFGFSRQFEKGQRSTSFCGTRPYSAPQVVTYQPYDGYAADWYSVGIVLYTMIVGNWPKEPKLNVALNFPPDSPTHACRRLIARLLDDDENRRAGFEECLYSEWLAPQSNWMFADANFAYTVLQHT